MNNQDNISNTVWDGIDGDGNDYDDGEEDDVINGL
jgi:hypothetical protein